MSLSSFWAIPCQGHLEQAKRICSYLYRMRHVTIRFRTHERDYSDLPNVKHKWDASVYGDVEEELPYKAPPPLGKQVILTHYVDANLYHSVLTGRSLGSFTFSMEHLLIGTPRNKPLSSLLPVGLSLLLPGHALSRSLISTTHSLIPWGSGYHNESNDWRQQNRGRQCH
jgi:hypothetical protein